MRTTLSRLVLAGALLAGAACALAAQRPTPALYSDMRWRSIGPTRAGRARALAGVPARPGQPGRAGRPATFYAGFDNGGVWKTTDYGSTWQPIFDDQPTGSIGAIAVAPSNPDVIYVGSGAGIIRPDLATGDGVYKSTDGGRSWTHLGLRNSQMIANIAVDPRNPDRLFVAALGHPYGPNPERGIFRSTDGGRSFEKVLFKDDYTSGNDVAIDPADPNTVYAGLWRQQQSFREGAEFGGTGGGVFKSTDGGTTWKPLTEGLPPVIEANLAIAPGSPKVLYAMVAGGPPAGSAERAGPTTGVVGLYRSDDGGEHWRAVDAPSAPPAAGAPRAGKPDPRPLERIGGGDLPTLAVDPVNADVVYSASIVFWRTEDGGATWSAVRGAPGGDDYQKVWIDPTNNDVVFAVSDQGAVISSNRGASWSNWYTQSTAAMYHVSTDDAFPYRVCGGQQDSGSACVASRSGDGEITFRDWHPVNIQEYGIAAPDPSDPDHVYGSGRTGVSLYDRRTRQTSSVGPGAEQRGADFGRNVRTMPIAWSPLRPDALYYTSNVVWRSLDRGHSWTRISPDLARPSWAVPASAGSYAAQVTPSPQGAITALSLSPRDAGVIWAGTDDGAIQVTSDGGAHWRDVTPPALKPWTRIFNIEAGHFDAGTAYAAANTMRIDDANPHFWRTHDGGRSWTEIDQGLAPGAAANSIREDPRQKGLLYAATETQVWVSFDDGDHWQSLRLNMPAISVRDLQLKDDSTCLCSDLIAGTHGRGFWILDDVTPLRQANEAQRATEAAVGPGPGPEKAPAYLFRPATALRVRFGTNDPTPWPPEVAAGENPPPGGILDYYLASDAKGPVRLEILDAGGRVVRAYSSDDPVLKPDPGLDPEAYERVCHDNPQAPDCAVPLYWAAPQLQLSARAGMHRFSWDLRLDPVGGQAAAPLSDGGAAVPHHTFPAGVAPWAPAGAYTVRLTVDGRSYTQPLTLRLDPRVRTPAPALAQLDALSREMYDAALATHAAQAQARALSAALGQAQGQDAAAFKARVDSIAPAPPAGGPGGRGGAGAFQRPGGGAPQAPPTLEGASRALLGAAMAMQAADVAPTASQVAACARARADAQAVLARWTELSTTALTRLNAARARAGQPAIALPK